MTKTDRNKRARLQRRKAKRRRLKILLSAEAVLITALIFAIIIHKKNTVTENAQTVNTEPMEGYVEEVAGQDLPAEVIDVPDWVDVQLVDPGNPSRNGLELDGINDIVIHYVGNPGTTGQQNRDFYNQYDSDVSSHFVIGMEGEIILCIPLNERSSSSNDRNHDTISIEVCHPDDTGKFTDASHDSLRKLTKWLMDRYGLDSEHVIRHYDVTGKECPRYFVTHEDEWIAFKNSLTS